MFDRLCLIIGGEQRSEAEIGAGENVVNPADESILGRLPHARDKDLTDALEAAVDGLGRWRESSASQRQRILRRAAKIVRDRREEFSRVMTLEQGKPLAEAAAEWERVAETLEWNADAALAIGSTRYPCGAAELTQYSLPQPVGVCLALTAWNFPAILPARKLAPALAAGCAVILKAAEETPASAQALVESLQLAGLPDGVVNLVFGDPATVSTRLMACPEVRKVSFTGSVPVGKLLARQAADGLKRCTFELGGHAPALVFADADVETAAKTLAAFKFRNAGQVCIAPSRFFVDERVYPRFREVFVEHARGIVLGPGMDEGTSMGPMANRRRIEAIDALKQDAVERGARVLYEGVNPHERGFFRAPCVLERVPADAELMLREPFGPIAPLVPFRREAEAIEAANSLPYGLAAYVFTGSEPRAKSVAAALEAGSVAINTVTPAQPGTPFGGVKESGYGYEGGQEGIDAFLIKKLVSTPLGFVHYE